MNSYIVITMCVIVNHLKYIIQNGLGAIEEEIFYGKSFEDVIEKFARDINDCYAVMHGNVFKTAVEITDESGETKLFNCRACAVIDYYSEEIKK